MRLLLWFWALALVTPTQIQAQAVSIVNSFEIRVPEGHDDGSLSSDQRDWLSEKSEKYSWLHLRDGKQGDGQQFYFFEPTHENLKSLVLGLLSRMDIDYSLENENLGTWINYLADRITHSQGYNTYMVHFEAVACVACAGRTVEFNEFGQPIVGKYDTNRKSNLKANLSISQIDLLRNAVGYVMAEYILPCEFRDQRKQSFAKLFDDIEDSKKGASWVKVGSHLFDVLAERHASGQPRSTYRTNSKLTDHEKENKKAYLVADLLNQAIFETCPSPEIFSCSFKKKRLQARNGLGCSG